MIYYNLSFEQKIKTSELSSYYTNNPELISGVLTSGFFSFDEKREIFKNLLGSFNGKTVLDLGCGKCKLIPVLECFSIESYTGVDVLPDNFCYINSSKIDFHYKCLTIRDFLVSNTTKYDLILLLDVYEHLEQSDLILDLCYKALKKNGIFVISIPNYLNLTGLFKKIFETFGSYSSNTWAPFSNCKAQIYERFVTGKNLKNKLKKHGFMIQKEIGWDMIAAFWPFIYDENALKGFWSKQGLLYKKFNILLMKNKIFNKIQMYYIVSSTKI